MSKLFTELKRRNVFKAAIAYIIAGWLIMQVVDVMFPALLLPDWTTTFVAALVLIGFPIALILAWAFEMTPDGIKREKEVDRSKSITNKTGRKIDFMIIGLLSLGVVYLVINYVIAPDAGRTTGREVIAKSVAVLPFANLSNNEENAPFAAGIHDDLLTRLSKIHELKVISRTSVLRYEDTDKSIPEIALELGVATVVEGGVQRAGNRVRINAQLIDADTDEHLWAETYDRELSTENIFSIQSEIAEAISAALAATLTPQEALQINAVLTENLEAYDLYLLGQQYVTRGSYEALRQAAVSFQRAADLDPNFAEAWVGVALANIRLNRTGALRDDELRDKAQPALSRALALNDTLAEAHAMMGAMESELGADPVTIENAFRRALELDPNSAESLTRYGIYLSQVANRPRDALPVFEKAVALDPMSQPTLYQTAGVQRVLGRFDEALQTYARIREISPGSPGGYYGAAAVYNWTGRVRESAYLYERAVEIDPNDPELIGALGLYWLDLGDAEKAEYWIDRAAVVDPNASISNSSRVGLYLYRGQDAEALALSRKMLESDVELRWGAESVFLRTARDHARETGEYEDILGWYEQYKPGLFADPIKHDFWSIGDAVDLAWLYQQMGESERAEVLARSVIGYENDMRSRGFSVSALPGGTAGALVVLGDYAGALANLREGVDSGWRWLWWWQMANEVYDPIRDEPDFQAMMSELEADMAAQRARPPEIDES
jgi:TolB-like protein/Tfp pilus assembly protein PilF